MQKGPTSRNANLSQEENDCRHRRLFGEELTDVRECFKLQGIACGIKEEHGGLLADLTLEADVGLDDEIDACAAQTVSQCLPLLHRKDDSEVRNRNIVAIYRIMVNFTFARWRL